MGADSGGPLATEEALLRRHGASRPLNTRAGSLGAYLNRLKKIIFYRAMDLAASARIRKSRAGAARCC
jgi:hypothetical protein